MSHIVSLPRENEKMDLRPGKIRAFMQAFMGAVLSVILLSISPQWAEAETGQASSVARLSQVVDDVYVLGDGDVEWSYAEPNLVLEQGDLFRTGETGMAEVQFDEYLVLRIGEDSKAAIVAMDTEKVVGIERGGFFVRVARDISPDEEFILTFPGGQIAAVGSTLAKIEVSGDGSAVLQVIRGEIGLATKSEEARSVSAGIGISIDTTGKTKPHSVDIARSDRFDEWNEERDIALSTYKRPKQVARNVVGAEELDGYGEWVDSGTYSARVWRPYVIEGWKPYSNGRWYYSNRGGWTWITAEPWGYVTHHYGSWNYDPHYGWVWMPGSVWYPARVEWIEYDDYIGWVPVGHYGYPVIAEYPYYIVDPYWDFVSTLTFTFVLYDHFYYHHYQFV